ncbi:hypothetical protein SUGI_1143930 [Cryptomeria japonica]|nr:hypothetical protein SUGI_1143930 [Cryptomeria japonica]
MLYPLYQTQGATGGGSTPHTVQSTPGSRVVLPLEGLLVVEMSQLDDIMLSAIDFGQDSYAFTPPASRRSRVRKPSSSTPRQKKISSQTPKRQKKHMGFMELMNAPDVNEVQQREEEMVIAASYLTRPPKVTGELYEASAPCKLPIVILPFHFSRKDKDEPRTTSKRLDFDDLPQS